MRLFLLLACLPLAACNASDDTRNPGADVYNLDAVDKEAMDTRETAAREAEDKRLAEERAQAEANAAAENAMLENATVAEAPAPVNARYRCMDGTKIAVRFNPANGRAAVARDGRVLAVLQQERAASGIWYKGNGHELRGKGDDLTFTQPNLPPIPCTVIR
ncbi:MliC family protein [Sphingomonas sp. AOB5]|uniref:MliC family protein n=1 Tax=Sphingomonas sp. AOB5 TaxID=3034017 RepID=UPI0023F983A3|nr:MliC family protein [Sphingomonas sp. AOB5]MDF7775160.1 MliC family protein [Sphingomonas sp. AOB5]